MKETVVTKENVQGGKFISHNMPGYPLQGRNTVHTKNSLLKNKCSVVFFFFFQQQI
jgi:hypothetical protein